MNELKHPASKHVRYCAERLFPQRTRTFFHIFCFLWPADRCWNHIESLYSKHTAPTMSAIVSESLVPNQAPVDRFFSV